nr:AtpZ/AtpI family protein [Desulfurispira natronophila]
MANAGSIGIAFVLALGLCLFIGYWVDEWLGWHPWGKIVGLIYGVAAGLRNMWVMAKRYGGMNENDSTPPKP